MTPTPYSEWLSNICIFYNDNNRCYARNNVQFIDALNV